VEYKAEVESTVGACPGTMRKIAPLPGSTPLGSAVGSATTTSPEGPIAIPRRVANWDDSPRTLAAPVLGSTLKTAPWLASPFGFAAASATTISPDASCCAEAGVARIAQAATAMLRTPNRTGIGTG
jgi:hypothetical protein